MSQITSPQYRKAFILVTTLFFMWGLSYGLIDVLNKHFQVTLNVSKAQSGLIRPRISGPISSWRSPPACSWNGKATRRASCAA